MVIFNWANWSEPSYNGPYPDWARAIGWMITISSVMWIPIVIIFEFIRSEGGVMEVSNQETKAEADLRKRTLSAAYGCGLSVA